MRFKTLLSKTISVNVSFFLLLQQSMIAGEIISDVTANSSFQATVEKAPNGIPVVNIVKPNETGLSHNKFSDYNVNKEGAILNNSNQREVNTQLAGYIYGNKNLAGGNTATTILNEVTSRNKTELKGFTEIAGDRANVIIANENGVYINGAGFINTQKATITTGAVNLQNGRVDNYQVRDGEIQIDGDGLNISNVDKAELYSKVVKLNAKIHAQDLDIVTGKNVISNDGSVKKIEELDNEKSEVSIDSSLLGGIYANKISLIGTQDGVGVNLPIEISAQDDLKISSDGKISLDRVVSNKNLEIKSNSNDINTNIVYANSVNLEAKNEINNKDIIASKMDVNLKATKIVNENLIASGVNEDLSDSIKGNLNISSEILENKKTLYSKDDLNINSKNIKGSKNSNILAKKDIFIKSENIQNQENVKIEAKENLDIKNEKNFISNNSNIQASNIDIKADNFEANNSKFTATSGDINLNSRDLSLNSSVLNASKYLFINTDYLKNISGYIQALNDVNITSKYIDNQNGVIVTNKNLIINSLEDGYFNNFKGILQSKENLVLDIFNIKTDDSIIQASNIDVKANNFEAVNSKIIAINDNLELDVNNINLSNSYLKAQTNLNLNSKNSLVFKDNSLIANNLYLKADEISLDGSNQTKNILYSTNDIKIDSKKFIANNLLAQANNNINIDSSLTDLKNSKFQSVAFIGSNYINGYKQGDINLTSSNINLYNTTLASKDINLKNQDNEKLTNLVVENTSFDVNNSINIATSILSSKNSKYLASNNLDLNIDKSVVFFNNSFSGLNLNLSIDENLTLDKSNSFSAQDSLVFNTKSLVNNAQLVSNGNLTINTSDFIVNNSLINAKNILNLNATNYILNNDSNEPIFGIKAAYTNLNTKLLTNYGFISSLYDMNIKVDDLVNYAGIASGNSENQASNMNIEATNVTNYNTIYSNDNINLYVKNNLLNETNKNIVNLGNEKAVIFATNNINIQGNKDKSLRTNEIINDKSIIQTQNGDINIFAKKLENLNDEVIIDVKDNESKNYSFKPEGKKLYITYQYNYDSEGMESSTTTSIGEEKIIKQLEKEDIQSGKYYNLNTINSPCGSNVWGKVVSDNCYDKSNNSFIINNITYSKNEYDMKEIYTHDEYDSYTTWEVKYKDRSSSADELIKLAYNIEPSRVLTELEKLYIELSNIMTPIYIEASGSWFNRASARYALEIIDNNYYRNNATNYNFNYISTIDYFLNKPDIKKGAEILSGKNINFDVLDINNYISKISAKNDMTFNNTILNNQTESLYQYDSLTGQYRYCYKECNSFWHNPDYTWASFTPQTSQIKVDSLNSIIEAGNKISGSLAELNNENKARVSTIEFTTYTPTTDTTLKTVDVQTDKKATENQDINSDDINLDKVVLNPIDETFQLPTNKYSMFTTVNPNKNLNYLVESNPLYINLSNFIGSQYFIDKMNYQGDRITKRLGDAGYETKLISDSIFKQTGQRFLGNYTSENAQFVALMDNAINLSGILGLEIGKALSKEQLVNLTEDIVWMEEKEINGQIVLAPVVYLAKDYNKSQGATIQAKNIDLEIKESLVNSGTIKTDEYIKLNANSIINNQGVILSNGKATLVSNDDFVNKNGGLIKASEIQIASLNGSVINETYSKTNNITQGKNDTTYTNLGKISTIEAINGNLVILAKDNITNIGANLIAKDNILLQTQIGDINLNAIKLENGHNVYNSGGFDKAKDVKYQTSNVKANNIVLNSGNNINLEASKLNANNQINLNAINDVNVTAVNDIHYTDVQTSKKGTFSKKTQRDMSYKEEVVSSELNAKDIYMTSGNDINLEAVNINAKNEKIAHAQNSLNILAKIYKEGELHHTSKSSFGGMIKNEYKYEKDNLKIKSSEITANNVILDAKTINLEASKLKANQIEITTDILNMISSKESLYENEFSNKGGILTATIENKGKIEEIVVPSTIEVNDKLIFNKKDITSQLESDNLVKILSSQGNLTDEQINLVKQIANSKEWHDKTTTLSGVGALIITVIVTYFTAGAGAGIAGTLSGATAAGASVTATQIATQAAIQAVIQTVATQASVQLAGSVITGNKVDLDLDSIAKSAVTAGVLSYANGLVNGIDNLDKVTKTVTNTTIQSGVQSVVFKTDFKDTLVSNLAMAGTNLAFENVGDYEVDQLKQGDTSWSDGSLNKTVTHALVGGTVSAIQNKDILSGALSAGVREALSPLTVNSEEKTQLLASQLTGILVGGLAGGEQGANNGYIISTSAEQYNRQLHQDEIKQINAQIDDFSNKTGMSKEKSLELLTLAGNMLVDENAYNEYTNSTKYIGVDFLTKDVENAMNYLKTNSQGKTFLDMPTQQKEEYFTSQEYMYKNSDWNPNIKEFYYVPTYSSQSNDILANQITQQTWYERQKGAEERFDIVSMGGHWISVIGKEINNPVVKNIGLGLNYGGTAMKYLVTPDEIKDYQIYNEIVPPLFQVEPLEGETK